MLKRDAAVPWKVATSCTNI